MTRLERMNELELMMRHASWKEGARQEWLEEYSKLWAEEEKERLLEKEKVSREMKRGKMTKSWRPKDWNKTIEKFCGENPHPYDVFWIEAGANAMLEAVKKELGKLAFLLDKEDDPVISLDDSPDKEKKCG